ncbi:MAG: hypothetical protein JKY66_05085 [Spongiibacteraceae bacterium]|nr:hypothetical protein [Spongiibacteraceae bacterium]
MPPIYTKVSQEKLAIINTCNDILNDVRSSIPIRTNILQDLQKLGPNLWAKMRKQIRFEAYCSLLKNEKKADNSTASLDHPQRIAYATLLYEQGMCQDIGSICYKLIKSKLYNMKYYGRPPIVTFMHTNAPHIFPMVLFGNMPKQFSRYIPDPRDIVVDPWCGVDRSRTVLWEQSWNKNLGNPTVNKASLPKNSFIKNCNDLRIALENKGAYTSHTKVDQQIENMTKTSRENNKTMELKYKGKEIDYLTKGNNGVYRCSDTFDNTLTHGVIYCV